MITVTQRCDRCQARHAVAEPCPRCGPRRSVGHVSVARLATVAVIVVALAGALLG